MNSIQAMKKAIKRHITRYPESTPYSVRIENDADGLCVVEYRINLGEQA